MDGDVNELEIFEVIVEASLVVVRLPRFEAPEDEEPEEA